ncbi:MAG: transketolase family protein [Caulobacteraceae bacterium]
MRNAFCAALVELQLRRQFLFFTGDLGFMALEPLQAALGDRFVNAGIAEQNMVSVAAGAASIGEQCWAYSIAPFIYGRPFEQIRNDVCLHDFDVKLVGNGGGYGYGVMGATHHAIEDYGALLTLQNMRAYVPAFAADVAAAVERMSTDPHPAYLRLGRCEVPAGTELPTYAPWRRLLCGDAGVLVAIGPVVGAVIAAASALPSAERPEIWVVSELPLEFAPPPEACLQRIHQTGALYVLEEHVRQGGLGQMLSHHLLSHGISPRLFRHFHAQGYPSRTYGSQNFHRVENGLDAATVLRNVAQTASV